MQNFEEWEDEKMLENGSEPSLLNFMRTTVQNFIRNPFIDQLILGMTLFLCVVIFSEMGLPNNFDVGKNGQRNVIGEIYYQINNFLLTFFVIEIFLKLFADGFAFISEFINVFDSIVVLVSFVF